jgi:hypothetical protein
MEREVLFCSHCPDKRGGMGNECKSRAIHWREPVSNMVVSGFDAGVCLAETGNRPLYLDLEQENIPAKWILETMLFKGNFL